MKRVFLLLFSLALASDILVAHNQINETVCDAIIASSSTAAFDALLHERVFAPQLSVYARNYTAFPPIGSDTGYVLHHVNASTPPIEPSYAPHATWIVTGMLLLNSDVGGGEVVLGRQQRRFAPQCGLLLLFPNSYTHPVSVSPVRIGQMHFIVMWYRANEVSATE